MDPVSPAGPAGPARTRDTLRLGGTPTDPRLLCELPFATAPAVGQRISLGGPGVPPAPYRIMAVTPLGGDDYRVELAALPRPRRTRARQG